MPDLQKILGKVIRRERQGCGLTMKELGDKAGLSEIYIGEIERGQKYPSAKVLESLADALNLDIADLLEITAEEFRVEQMPQPVEVVVLPTPSHVGRPGRSGFKNFVDLLDTPQPVNILHLNTLLRQKHSA